MTIFKIVLSPHAAIPLQVAKRGCAPHSYVLHKVHLNTQLPSTFNGNGLEQDGKQTLGFYDPAEIIKACCRITFISFIMKIKMNVEDLPLSRRESQFDLFVLIMILGSIMKA